MARPTSQQIADLMLAEDRARRNALRAGDVTRAAKHDAEMRRAASILNLGD